MVAILVALVAICLVGLGLACQQVCDELAVQTKALERAGKMNAATYEAIQYLLDLCEPDE